MSKKAHKTSDLERVGEEKDGPKTFSNDPSLLWESLAAEFSQQTCCWHNRLQGGFMISLPLRQHAA